MKKLNEMKKNKKGFTLIEMIVVIVIIAILAAIAVPAVMKYIDEARDTKLITHAGSAKTSLEAELAKYQAKNPKGVYDEATTTNFDAAVTAVKGDVTDVEDINVCGAASVTDGKYTCSAVADKTLKAIGGYVVKFADDKFVVIDNDGSAEVAKAAATASN